MSKENKIVFASTVALIANSILTAAKIIVGIISGSLAVLADGFDSASDIISSTISLFAAKLLKRPPDAKYSYGYDKADTVAAKIIAFFMLFAGVQLCVSVISQFIKGETREIPTLLAIIVTVVSIMMKFFLSVYLKNTGQKTKSQMLIANAKNMKMDILLSLSVLVGLFFTIYLELPIIDQIAALAISLWIIYAGFKIFIETSRDLMDGLKDDKIYREIFCAIDSVSGVYNPHRVRTRKIGSKYMINIDIEVNGNITLKAAHDLAHKVERTIKKQVEDVFDVAIHVEPIGDDTKEKQFGLTRESLN